jgi:1-acylglycerol-3-phosphate O-acyltransferases
MRTIIVVLYLVIFGVFSLFALPFLWLVGKFNEKLKQKISQNIVKSAFGKILFISGIKKNVIGLERVPRDESVLFIFNHRGFFDIILAYYTVPVLASFVSKKEIAKVPGLRVWMRNIKCVFLDRENPREGIKAILKGIENIQRGTSMFISPEGTRNSAEGLLPFKPGSLKMAEKAGCPIVPVAITNSDKVFEDHLPWIKSNRMTIEYGEPIYIHELSKESRAELLELSREEVLKLYEKNTQLAL